jgi:hypothetical protein
MRARDLIRAHVVRQTRTFRSGDAIVRVGPATWSTSDIELEFVCNRIVNMQKLIEQVLRAHGFRAPEEFGSMELQPLRARSSDAAIRGALAPPRRDRNVAGGADA